VQHARRHGATCEATSATDATPQRAIARRSATFVVSLGVAHDGRPPTRALDAARAVRALQPRGSAATLQRSHVAAQPRCAPSANIYGAPYTIRCVGERTRLSGSAHSGANLSGPHELLSGGLSGKPGSLAKSK
jgi:hypothetical protein